MATKIKRVVVGVLVTVALLTSGCNKVSYNGDTSTWKAEQPAAAGQTFGNIAEALLK